MTNDKFSMTNENMKYLNKIIEYGLYLLVFLLPLQTRWIIKAGEFNNGPWEYGTYGVYGTDVLLATLLIMYVVFIILNVPNFQILWLRQIWSWLRQISCAARRSQTNPNDQKNTKYKIQDTNLFIIGLALTSFISVLFAANRLLALYKFGWLILGVGLFWLVASANYDRLKLIYALSAGAFLQAGLGIWQFFTQSSFANKWLGLALHRGSDLGASVIETIGADGVGERWLRAYGGMDHPNMLGGMLAVGILLLIHFILIDKKSFGITNYELSGYARSRVARRIKNKIQNTKLNSIKFFIFYFLLIIFSAALFFSFSRSAWLGLAVGLMVMIALAVAGRNLKLQKGLVEIILVMGIVLFVLFSQYQNLITSRLAGQGRLEEKSTSERLVSYQESWQLIKNNWLFGAGLGNYTLALNRQIPGQASFYYQPTHNVFMLVLSEIGIFGLMFFVLINLSLLIFSFKKRLSSSGDPALDAGENPGNQKDEVQINLDSPPAFASAEGRGNDKAGVVARDDKNELAPRNDNMTAILIALVVIMSLDHWLWSLHFGVLFFWLVLGLLAGGNDKTKLWISR